MITICTTSNLTEKQVNISLQAPADLPHGKLNPQFTFTDKPSSSMGHFGTPTFYLH